jgi:hypothetical protein
MDPFGFNRLIADKWDIVMMYPGLFAAVIGLGFLVGIAVTRIFLNERLVGQQNDIAKLRAILEEKLPPSFLPQPKRSRPMSFSFILGGLGLAFVGIAIAIGGAVWQMRTTQADSPITPLKMPGAAQPHTATAPAAPPPRIATAPADVPKKLAAIDELRQILNGDMATWINKGQQLSTGEWWNWYAGDQVPQMQEAARSFFKKSQELDQEIQRLQNENVQFPDIHALASSPLGTPFLLRIEKLVTPILALPDDPSKKMGNDLYRFLFEPYAKETYAALNDVENWRRITDRNALQLRQQISQ